MGLGDLLGGDAGQVMTVHEERHPVPFVGARSYSAYSWRTREGAS